MKLEIPENKKLIHVTQADIRWGDMDAFGHVNNTVYFRYMEMARIDFLRQSGVVIDPKGHGFVIANVFCNFLQQLEFPGEVLIKTYVGSVGRSSFDTYHEMLRTDTGDKVYANGGATIVWVDLPNQKSVPIPAGLRQHLLD